MQTPHKLRKPYRQQHAEYTAQGLYAVTVTTRDLFPWFGTVQDATLLLSRAGKTLVDLIQARIAPRENAVRTSWIDTWSLLPDRMHLIVATTVARPDAGPVAPVFAPADASPERAELDALAERAVASFVNLLKGRLESWCGLNGSPDFAWQDGFEEEVIREEAEYRRIRAAMLSGASNWSRHAERA